MSNWLENFLKMDPETRARLSREAALSNLEDTKAGSKHLDSEPFEGDLPSEDPVEVCPGRDHMNDFWYFLDHYPLEKHYADCKEYMYREIDWSAKSKEIREKRVTYFDVSDVISLFPHLELDENYELICYLSSEYHGIWGRVAAIESGAAKTPVINPEVKWYFQSFELPESAARPMEAIYNDGTPEGYFEAILCSIFLYAIPYAHYEQESWDRILSAPPADIDKNWNTYITIPDWRPHAVIEERPDTILAFRQELENGFGGSSGRERIYLTEYSFFEKLIYYHAFSNRNGHSMYRGRIDNDKRYTGKRHCCVFSESSLLIAKEKPKF